MKWTIIFSLMLCFLTGCSGIYQHQECDVQRGDIVQFDNNQDMVGIVQSLHYMDGEWNARVMVEYGHIYEDVDDLTVVSEFVFEPYNYTQPINQQVLPQPAC